MTEGYWKHWRRALAIIIATILIIEGMPLQAFALSGRDSYIPLIQSDEDEEDTLAEDYTEDAELIDDRPLLASGLSLRALRVRMQPSAMRFRWQRLTSHFVRLPAAMRRGRDRWKMPASRQVITT